MLSKYFDIGLKSRFCCLRSDLDSDCHPKFGGKGLQLEWFSGCSMSLSILLFEYRVWRWTGMGLGSKTMAIGQFYDIGNWTNAVHH